MFAWLKVKPSVPRPGWRIIQKPTGYVVQQLFEEDVFCTVSPEYDTLEEAEQCLNILKTR